MSQKQLSRTEATFNQLQEATIANPCPHCGKPDWCYSIGELTVCNRDADPARGWEPTSKTDRNGKPYYAPTLAQKPPRPQGKREYIYHDRNGQPLVKVTRVDDGNGKKRIFQSHWNGINWVKGLTDEVKKSVSIYRYAQVREAISDGQTIFIVEGEGIADLLWSMNIPATTTIGGAGKYRAYGNYQPDLESATLVLCPDRDEPGLKHMEDIFKDFPDAKWLYAPPNEFYWTHLPSSGGLDLADWVAHGATTDNILQAIEDRRVIVNALNKSLEAEAIQESLPTKSKHAQHFNLIRAVLGDHLRWNTLKKQVERDGVRLPMNGIKTYIARELDIDLGREDAKELVLVVAQENSYSPVVEYLESVAALHPDADVSILDEIAPKYLGTTDPLHAALMKRTLIAAVARAFQPGCKHDNITILQGQQGAYKSTFWSTLAGDGFFTDDITSGSEKDEILKLSQYWFLEYAEFESAYRKKEVSQLKAFLSRRSDSIRRPYGTDIEDMLRPSIMVGSTNKGEFLHDPTGERRYWVIVVQVNKINISLLQQERDLIWAAAVKAYKQGEQWWLTQQEDAALNEANGQYQTTDSWESPIANYLSGRPYVVVGDILTEVLKLELPKQDRATVMRVAEILRGLGWQKSPKQRRINGKPHWVWEPSVRAINPDCRDTDITQVVSEVVTPQNQSTISVSVPNHLITNKGCDEVVTEVVTPSKPYTDQVSSNCHNLSQPLNETFTKIDEGVKINSAELLLENIEVDVTGCDSKRVSPRPEELESLPELDCEDLSVRRDLASQPPTVNSPTDTATDSEMMSDLPHLQLLRANPFKEWDKAIYRGSEYPDYQGDAVVVRQVLGRTTVMVGVLGRQKTFTCKIDSLELQCQNFI